MKLLISCNCTCFNIFWLKETIKSKIKQTDVWEKLNDLIANIYVLLVSYMHKYLEQSSGRLPQTKTHAINYE